MPIIKSELEPGKGPDGPHLALVTGHDGTAIAIPVGAFIYIVPEPGRPDRIIPVNLQKVTRDVLQFKCACGQRECSRILSYKLRVSGHHPEQFR